MEQRLRSGFNDQRVDEWQLRRELVNVCRHAYERGMISGTDGNVSGRLHEDRYLITPAGVNKGQLKPVDFVEVDLEGRMWGGGKASTERAIHSIVYRNRPDVWGMVHAHPPSCVALTLAKKGMMEPIIPEIVGALGRIPTAPYATPGTQELPLSLLPFIKHNAILMERHGSVTVGGTPKEALDRLEMIEHAAEILVKAYSLGLVEPMTSDEVFRLRGNR